MRPSIPLVLAVAACNAHLGDTPPETSAASRARVEATSWSELDGTETYGYLGWTVSGGFDLDGDGHPEVGGYALNTYGYNGSSHLWYGSASGYASAPDVTFAGTVYAERLGDEMAAGDVNADGYDDLLLTGYAAAHLHYGSAAHVTETDDVTFTGDSGGFGLAVGVTDIDGDGDADVVVGDLALATVSVFAGDPAGVSATADATYASPSGSSADGFGTAIATGDYDGDGYGDVLVGAPNELGGTAYVLGGGVGGLSVVAQADDGPDGSAFGTFVATAGDLDGDGLDDFAVGAPSEDTEGDDAGAAYVYLGGSASSGVYTYATRVPGELPGGMTGLLLGGGGDTDHDGHDELVVGCNWSSGCSFALYDGAAGGLDATDVQSFGAYGAGDVAFVGDADGDGYDDLAVGAPAAGGGGTSRGQIDVRRGYQDLDGDGYGGGGADSSDCDDTDAGIHPGADDPVYDGVDQACDGETNDLDGDGYDAAIVGGPDCDDTNAHYHPGAVEIPTDGIDQDCDGGDLCFADLDDDGYLDESGAMVASADLDCEDAGEGKRADPATDCDDQDPDVHPGVTDTPADGVDADCDGAETCLADADQDGFVGDATVQSDDPDCADPGEALTGAAGGDCDDADPDVYPGATDVADDGVDQDCDGEDVVTPDDGAKSTCGCSSEGGGAPAWLALGALLALRRRR